MAHVSFSRSLQGGDRRSLGNANRIAAHVLKNPARFTELIECMWSDDPVVRMRAADAVEKISVRKPGFIAPFKAELLGLADEATQAEVRWHLALMLPRLPLTKSERTRFTARLHAYLDDRSSIVKTCALQGLADMARSNLSDAANLLELLQQVCRTGTAAMKARSRRLLKELHKS
jgi:hypothetical protein